MAMNNYNNNENSYKKIGDLKLGYKVNNMIE